MNFNEAQQRAIRSTAPRTAVVAGPGSGKTAVLVQRALAADPARTVILTFTNAGAREVSRRLTERGTTVKYVGTLHGYCLRLIETWGNLLGYRAHVNLLQQEDADQLLVDAAAFLGWKGSKKKMLAESRQGSTVLAAEYQQRLKINNLVDYDAVLSVALRLLTMSPLINGKVLIGDLLVDEAQDSAEIDWFIYLAIRAERKFIVGDPDQSIYGFRFAWPEGFLRFARHAEEQIILSANYRSGVGVCRTATKLLSAVPETERIPKPVVPATERGDIVDMRAYGDDRQERLCIAGEIGTMCISGDYAPDQIAILLRTHALRVQFRDALKGQGVPISGQEYAALPGDWPHTINVLRMLHDPRNDLIAEQVMFGMDRTGVTAAKEQAAREEKWLSDWVRPMVAPQNLEETLALLPGLHCSRESVLLVGERIGHLPQPQPGLADLLRDLHHPLLWSPAASPGVTVTTLHAAKSHEWPVVYLPACEDGILPKVRKSHVVALKSRQIGLTAAAEDATAKEVAEERRLFFVGITRAQERLYVSHVHKRTNEFGATTEQRPSPFITEAGL